MKAAQIITFISGIIYVLFLIQLLVISTKLNSVYSDINIDYNYLVPQIIVHILGIALIIGNFSFFYYLRKKSRRNEEVKNALLFSILLAVPLPFYSGFAIISVILPIYSITSAF